MIVAGTQLVGDRGLRGHVDQVVAAQQVGQRQFNGEFRVLQIVVRVTHHNLQLVDNGSEMANECLVYVDPVTRDR